MVQLSPTRSAKLSFSVQLVLALFWLAWATILLLSDDTAADQGFLHYIFFGLALLFTTYVVLQNTSVFGVQSYIEVTPQYIVYKQGVFRKKHIVAIPDINSIHISTLALRITEKSGKKIYLDLKQVRKKRDLEKIKNKIREIAATHGFAVTDAGNIPQD
jgi:hypothetical protein